MGLMFAFCAAGPTNQQATTAFLENILFHFKDLDGMYKSQSTQSICVDFSFCCITFDPIDFLLQQNIPVVSRQALILWELHQVWEQPSVIVLLCVVYANWAHALNSEHA